MTATAAIEAAGLRKAFGPRQATGRVQALDGLGLSVPCGTVCSLLGPNGAGKTTAVRILATLAKPDSGTAMRRRLDVVASLIVSPRVLFLEEPTTGLDPRSRAEIWSAIRALAKEGTTILFGTPKARRAPGRSSTR